MIIITLNETQYELLISYLDDAIFYHQDLYNCFKDEIDNNIIKEAIELKEFIENQ